MQLQELLAQTGGLQAMARELGMPEAQVADGAGAMLPALLGGLHKQAQANPAAGDGLGSLLDQLGGGSLLDQVVAAQPTDVAPGNDLLGQLFGSKEVSRAVAGNAAAQTGLDAGMLRKMLPLLAMLVTGYFAKQQAGAAPAGPGAAAAGGLGGLGGLLGGLLGGAQAPAGAAGGLGGLLSAMDADGNGNPLDDILRGLGQSRG